MGLGANRTNSILQAAFFALTKVIPLEVAVEDMKKNNYNSYFKEGRPVYRGQEQLRCRRRHYRRGEGGDP